MIHSIADRAMQSLSGYQQAEVYSSEAVVHTVYIDDSKISNIETKVDRGMMARMADGGICPQVLSRESRVQGIRHAWTG